MKRTYSKVVINANNETKNVERMRVGSCWYEVLCMQIIRLGAIEVLGEYARRSTSN